MNSRVFLWVVLGIAAGGVHPLPAADLLSDRTLTLEESVKLALNNSQGLLTTREDVNIASQRVREAESLFYPKLDLNANWSKFRVEGGTPLLLQPGLGPTLVPNSDRQNFYTTRANIYQTVYAGGRYRNTWRQARVSYERAKTAGEALEGQVSSAAKEAFYDLLLAQEKKRLYAEALGGLQAGQRQTAGGSAGEQLQWESEAALLRADSSRAELEEQERLLAYLHTLNLELNTRVALKGELVTHPVDIDLQRMLAWSTQYRAELRQTEFQEELDALGISLSLAERTPTIGLGATYERTGDDVSLPTANWAGTVNVNLPVSLSDMFYGWAKVRERRAQYRQATLKYAETSDQIQMQVRQAYMKYRFWQNELSPRENELRRIQSLVESVRGGALERVRAKRLWVASKLRYLEAVHGHLTALAELERAIGHPLNTYTD